MNRLETDPQQEAQQPASAPQPCPDVASARLIQRRYYLGPYHYALFILFKEHGPRRTSIRFKVLKKKKKKALAELMDGKTAVYKLPAWHTCVVELSEVKGGRFTFDVRQFPRISVPRGVRSYSAEAEMMPNEIVVEDPPHSECTGDCPPYTIDCPPGEDPSCSTGSLRCVILESEPPIDPEEEPSP